MTFLQHFLEQEPNAEQAFAAIYAANAPHWKENSQAVICKLETCDALVLADLLDEFATNHSQWNHLLREDGTHHWSHLIRNECHKSIIEQQHPHAIVNFYEGLALDQNHINIKPESPKLDPWRARHFRNFRIAKQREATLEIFVNKENLQTWFASWKEPSLRFSYNVIAQKIVDLSPACWKILTKTNSDNDSESREIFYFQPTHAFFVRNSIGEHLENVRHNDNFCYHVKGYLAEPSEDHMLWNQHSFMIQSTWQQLNQRFPSKHLRKDLFPAYRWPDRDLHFFFQTQDMELGIPTGIEYCPLKEWLKIAPWASKLPLTHCKVYLEENDYLLLDRTYKEYRSEYYLPNMPKVHHDLLFAPIKHMEIDQAEFPTVAIGMLLKNYWPKIDWILRPYYSDLFQ